MSAEQECLLVRPCRVAPETFIPQLILAPPADHSYLSSMILTGKEHADGNPTAWGPSGGMR